VTMVTYPRQLTDARYQVVAYLFVAVLAALALDVLLRGLRTSPWRRRILAGLGLLAVLSMTSYRDLLLKHDIDVELEFVREVLPTLPRDTIIYYANPNDSAPCPGEKIDEPLELGLAPPTYLVRALDRPDVSWAPWPPKPGDEGRPMVYYQMANCHAIPQAKYYEAFLDEEDPEWMNPPVRRRFETFQCQCERALQVLGPRVVASTEVPRRSWSRVRYDDAWVPVGFYVIRPEDVETIRQLNGESPCRPRSCPGMRRVPGTPDAPPETSREAR